MLIVVAAVVFLWFGFVSGFCLALIVVSVSERRRAVTNPEVRALEAAYHLPSVEPHR